MATVNREGARCGREELAALLRAVSNLQIRRPTRQEKIAVIGSGPAGLAAAHDLALMGFRPTIFEMEPVPAGMLAVGIPEYRLPRQVVQAEVEVIRALGVEIVCNTQVGKDITLPAIRQDYKATVIAVGAKRSRELAIPGSEAPRVLGGVEVLRDLNLHRPVDLGARVVVIGGGGVAYDVSRSLARGYGAEVSRAALHVPTVREVHLCCLESLDEMPADDVEILEGEREGIVRHNRLGPKEIMLNPDGSVKAVRFKRCLSAFDAQGRFAPTFDETDVTTIPADTVLWAIGQRMDLSFLDPERDGVRLTGRGMIQSDPDSLRTSAEDVFVAGDVAHGARLTIDAVASGKRAARSVYRYLHGRELVFERRQRHVPVPGHRRRNAYHPQPRVQPPTPRRREPGWDRTASQTRHAPASSRQHLDGAVELVYKPADCTQESGRCLDCTVRPIFDSSKCLLCGGCVDVCPKHCLRIVSADRLDGHEQLDALVRRVLSGPSSSASAILKEQDRCIHCATCAERCPAGAITMERLTFEGAWRERPEPDFSNAQQESHVDRPEPAIRG